MMFLMRRELKQRVSESRAKRVWALPSVSCFDRRSNNVTGAKIMAETFGHSNIFATLSLSLRRSPIRETATPFILRAGRPRQYTAFLASMQEKSACFFVPVGRLRRGRRQAQRNKHLIKREQNRLACFAERENGRMKCNKQF